MPIKKIRKLFIKAAFLSAFFFLFSLVFFTKSVNACTPGQCVDGCHKCGSDGNVGPDYSCGGNWCACASANNYPPGWQANCGGAPPPPPPPPPAAAQCSGWDSVNCRGCANGQWGPTCKDYGPGGVSGAAAWCACEAKCGGGVKSTNCGGGANPGGGGGGVNGTKMCGQVCVEHGSTSGGSGCYCSNGSCPSPLVSLGNTSGGGDTCTPCCGWPAVAACSAPPPGGCVCEWVDYGCAGSSHEVTCLVGYRKWSNECNRGGCGDAQECRLDASCCTCSGWSDGVCASSGGCADGQRQQTRTCNPSGCQSQSQCVADPACWHAWFQTQGGDIHAQGSLFDNIPETATNRNLSLEDLNGYPGVVSYDPSGIGQIKLGSGKTSKGIDNNWLASSKYQGKPYSSFDFFKKKYALKMTPDNDNFRGTLPAQDGIYYSSTGQTLSGSWALGGNHWLVILVDGDVSIRVNITVPKGSFLAIASSGKITFAGSVAQAQGMFVANVIDTGDSAIAFAGEGIFAANTFDLNRDFANARNSITPAETFAARPDFLMSSYNSKDENLWWFFQKWEELAP